MNAIHTNFASVQILIGAKVFLLYLALPWNSLLPNINKCIFNYFQTADRILACCLWHLLLSSSRYCTTNFIPKKIPTITVLSGYW